MIFIKKKYGAWRILIISLCLMRKRENLNTLLTTINSTQKLFSTIPWDWPGLGMTMVSSFILKGQNILLRIWSLINLFIPAGAFPKIVMEIFMSLRMGAISYFIRKQKPSNPGPWQNHWLGWLALQIKMMVSGLPAKTFILFDT